MATGYKRGKDDELIDLGAERGGKKERKKKGLG